jgi:hypothetical protein
MIQKEKPLAAVSYLPVQEDFEQFQVAQNRWRTTPKEKLLTRAAGLAVLVLSAAFFLYSVIFSSGERAVWGILVIAGVLIACYRDILEPYVVRMQARSRFAVEQRTLVSQSVELFSGHMKIHTDRYQADLPYEMLYRAVETEKLYLLFLGKEEIRFIPKRVMTAEQCEQFTRVLKEHIRERYQIF